MSEQEQTASLNLHIQTARNGWILHVFSGEEEVSAMATQYIAEDVAAVIRLINELVTRLSHTISWEKDA